MSDNATGSRYAYTVILRSTEDGEIARFHVFGDDPDRAILAAQRDFWVIDEGGEPIDPSAPPFDAGKAATSFVLVAIFPGHIDSVREGIITQR